MKLLLLLLLLLHLTLLLLLLDEDKLLVFEVRDDKGGAGNRRQENCQICQLSRDAKVVKATWGKRSEKD